MIRRVAVVTPTYGEPWSEQDVVCRRLAGALATAAEVDVLVPSGNSEVVERDGAVRLVRLPAIPQPPARRNAILRALVGPLEDGLPGNCGCISAKRAELVDDLPMSAQAEVVRASGGDSPALARLLGESHYDVVVFAGYAAASTVFGVRHVDPGTRVVLLPLAEQGLLLRMRVLRELLERVNAIVVSTETERALVDRRPAGDAPVWNTGFVLRVNSAVLSAAPHGYGESQRNVLIPADWRGTRDHRWIARCAEAVAETFGPDVLLRPIGPGAARVLRQEGGEQLTSSRSDVWRWISRSVGVVDPKPHRLLGQLVLESMMFGTPVVVAAHGGASREHAQAGNGGLWYRTEAELVACVGALLDSGVRDSLGEQGRDYAMADYADSDRYVKAVVKSVLEEE